MGNVVVGTCSWADKTMIERWYPKSASTAESRLRYYADRFDTVEVDSSFYAIPSRANAHAWVERTPADFTFHVKAYGMLTGHEVDERALPRELREGDYDYTLTPRGRVRHPDERTLERAFELFSESVAPLDEAGKLGGILMQYPPWFTAQDHETRDRNLEHIAYGAAMLSPLRVLVEFRHSSWAEDANLARAVQFFAEHDLTFVCVDAPQVGGSAMPPVCASTGSIGYVRMHGRNREMWGARTQSAADRFDYLYTTGELEDWVEPVHALADNTERTYVMFNNCKYDYAPKNAREMAAILGDLVRERPAHTPTGEPLGESWVPAARMSQSRAETDAGTKHDRSHDIGRLF